MQMYSACSLFQVRPLVTNNKDKPRAHFCAVPLDSLNDNTTSLIGDIILVVMCGVLVAQQGEPIWDARFAEERGRAYHSITHICIIYLSFYASFIKSMNILMYMGGIFTILFQWYI